MLFDSLRDFTNNYHLSILSNTGGTSITKHTLAHWDSGNPREDLTHKELEEIINIGAFNEAGKFKK